MEEVKFKHRREFNAGGDRLKDSRKIKGVMFGIQEEGDHRGNGWTI